MKFKIEWDRDKSEIFFEGSIVQYDIESRSVYFKNDFFSPSSIIVRWSSKLQYYKEGTLLELPLLKRGASYRLSSQAFIHPKGGIQLKINFYNRSEELLGHQVFTLEGGVFTYLKEAYFYTIELINVGVEELLFDFLLLESVVNKKSSNAI